jgi:hypothetical protein
MSKLITYAYFKKETDISDIVDNNKLDNPIKNAHDHLRALIGKAFYDELVSQNSTTPKTLTAANEAFYDPYVSQFLAWKAYEFYIVKANTYESRVGVRIFREDNSEPASDKIMGEQIALAKKQAQFYKDEMLNFLRSSQRVNSSAYSLYTNSSTASSAGGFGISAVSKNDTVSFKIDNQIINQEP